MKFKIIATVVVLLFLIVLTFVFIPRGEPVDADGNTVPQEQPQQ